MIVREANYISQRHGKRSALCVETANGHVVVKFKRGETTHHIVLRREQARKLAELLGEAVEDGAKAEG